MATRDEIELVRSRTNLVDLIGSHVALKPRGREHVGLCPFHDDSRPSFAVVTHKGDGFYKCHACGAAGDCFRFVQDHLGKDFGDALAWLAERAGVELSKNGDDREATDRRRTRRDWLRKAMEGAQARFLDVLRHEQLGKDARVMIEARGYTPGIVDQFGLGAAADGWQDLGDHLMGDDMPAKVLVAAGLLKQRDDANHTYDAFRHRLMFPISDDTGQPIAFGGRALGTDETPKYLNSCEHDLFQKSRTLYGMHLARKSIMQQRTAIVAEGYTDVIALHQHGFTNAVGTLGTAMTPDHARTLARLCDEVILLFDGDEAGQRAAQRAIPIIASHQLDVRICVLEDGQDPDDVLRSSNGVELFTAALKDARDAFEYLFHQLEQQLAGDTGVSARQRRIETFVAGLRDCGLSQADTLRRAMLTARLGEIAGISPTIVDGLLRDTTPKASQQVTNETFEAMDTNADQTMASRRAEHEFLGAVIHTGRTGTLTDAIIELMHDPRACRIAMAIRSIAGRGDELTVPRLLDEVPATDRDLVSELFFSGEHLIASFDNDADAAIDDACNTLQRCQQTEDTSRRLDEWGADSSNDPQAAADLIEHLKNAPPRATAAPRVTTQ